jgi:hypothetical protein
MDDANSLLPINNTNNLEISSDIFFLEENELFTAEKPFAFRYSCGENGPSQTNMNMKSHPVVLKNIRGLEPLFSLENNGFEVIDVGNTVSYEEYHDKETVKSYFRILEMLIQKRLSASHVEVFRYGVSIEPSLSRIQSFVPHSEPHDSFENAIAVFRYPQVRNMNLISLRL